MSATYIVGDRHGFENHPGHDGLACDDRRLVGPESTTLVCQCTAHPHGTHVHLISVIVRTANVSDQLLFVATKAVPEGGCGSIKCTSVPGREARQVVHWGIGRHGRKHRGGVAASERASRSDKGVRRGPVVAAQRADRRRGFARTGSFVFVKVHVVHVLGVKVDISRGVEAHRAIFGSDVPLADISAQW